MTTSSQTFLVWLKQQQHRNDPIGDLARDALHDPDFPKGRPAPEVYLTYLQGRTSNPDVITAFQRAWSAYQTSQSGTGGNTPPM